MGISAGVRKILSLGPIQIKKENAGPEGPAFLLNTCSVFNLDGFRELQVRLLQRTVQQIDCVFFHQCASNRNFS